MAALQAGSGAFAVPEELSGGLAHRMRAFERRCPMTTVHLTVRSPGTFSRLHLLVRALLMVVVSVVAGSHGWPGMLLYFGLPALSAVLISEHGDQRFLSSDAKVYVRALTWLLGFYGYLGLLTDRFPTLGGEGAVQVDIAPTGSPTTGSAAMRFFTSIPAAIAMSLLGLVGLVVWWIAAIMVLINQRYPVSLFEFQAGVLRYHARFLAWHASLVDTYPASMAEHPSDSMTSAPQS